MEEGVEVTTAARLGSRLGCMLCASLIAHNLEMNMFMPRWR